MEMWQTQTMSVEERYSRKKEDKNVNSGMATCLLGIEA